MPAAAIACAVGALAVFVFLHTGARADGLCVREGAAVPDGLSWWPPGVRCSGGEPAHSKTELDPVVLLAVPGLAVLLFGGAALVGAPRR
jgi:hypothetical protein